MPDLVKMGNYEVHAAFGLDRRQKFIEFADKWGEYYYIHERGRVDILLTDVHLVASAASLKSRLRIEHLSCILGIYVTQSTTDRRDFRRGGRLSENHLGTGETFWRRGGLTELSVHVALGGGICMSALSDKRRLVDGQWPVALRGLSGAGVGDGWGDLLGQQAAADDVVSSDLATHQSKKTA